MYEAQKIRKGGIKKDRFEWSGKPWNPITGCTETSPGCAHCYAKKMATRFFRGKHGYPVDDPFRPGVIHEDKFDIPIETRTPTLFFVCSMSDLFHEAVPDERVQEILDICGKANHHKFVVLTKRAHRLNQGFKYPSNVWLGVSVENQYFWDERTAILRSVDANVRIVSIEPILEPVVMDDISWCDWIIVGKESGAGARPMVVEWFTNIFQQCRAAGVPFFSKQDINGEAYLEYPIKI
jgi:protein gp37